MSKSNMLHITSNTKCNLNCLYCNEGVRLNGDIVGDDFLGFEAINEKILYDLEKGNKDFNGVVFSSGEPTLNPSLPELIKYSRKIGYKKIEIVTNGIRISNYSYIKSLQEAGLNSIVISVNSFKPNISKIVSGNNYDGQATLKGVINSIKLNLNLTVNIVITKLTILSLNHTLLTLKKVGVKNVTLSYVRYEGFDERIYSPGFKFEVNKLTYSQCLEYFNDISILDSIKEFENFYFNDFPTCILRKLKISDYYIKKSKEYNFFIGNIDKVLSQKNAGANRIYLKSCKGCLFKGSCTGIEKTYVDIYGESFVSSELSVIN